ncbi:hypothetical protein PSEUDO9AZ_10607 [Pseudomonas sp. 9AZ]|nr:hypothetical protein PSEUDO9AZ_10607 [Pseudomonas sp. 9AZ]
MLHDLQTIHSSNYSHDALPSLPGRHSSRLASEFLGLPAIARRQPDDLRSNPTDGLNRKAQPQYDLSILIKTTTYWHIR